MEKGELKTEKVFIVGSYEEVSPPHDDIQTIQKTRLDGNVQHIAIGDLTGTTAEYQYLHRDHLGSVEKVTDESGTVILDTAFDPDGGRRQPDWSGDISEQQLEELLLSQNLTTRRGYTGHEHLDRTGLIHMNGRIYDPTLGRFLSPDPIVQAPDNSQSWNRYSYVFNNPMSLLDPMGYSAKDNEEAETKPIDCGQGCDGGEGSPEPIDEVDTEGTPGGGGTTIGGGGSWRPTTMGQISVMSGGGYRGSYGRSQASGMNKESSDGQTVEEPSCNEIECVTVTAAQEGNPGVLSNLHAGASGFFEDLFRVRYHYRALGGDFGPEEQAYAQVADAALTAAGAAYYSNAEFRQEVHKAIWNGINNNRAYFAGRQLTQGAIVGLLTRYSGTGIRGSLIFTASFTTVAGYGRVLNLYDQGVRDPASLLSGGIVGK